MRFVGGAVRDSLLSRPVVDIDIATTLPPEEVIRKAEAARLKAIPTGLQHGTVTLVSSGRPFEVTTLRRDVKTDGRRAEVAFHDDWEADAARRDFTINAIYAKADGTLFDPVGGAEDLQAGRVRFIGDAAKRIEEDALRILRFFRFHLRYGKGAPDAAGLAACRAAVDKLDILSIERIRDELMKILSADDPLPVLTIMTDIGVMTHVLPDMRDVNRLECLIAVEQKLNDPDALRRLFTLLPDRSAVEAAIRLKLSNVEKKRLTAMALGPVPDNWRESVYRTGKQAVIDRLIIHGPEPDPATLRTILTWSVPTFPVTGADLMKCGIPEGPELGEKLKELEERWIKSGFAKGRDDLLKRVTS